jgi:hypothetical protein
MKAFSFGTLLSKSVLFVVDVSFTFPTAWPAPVSSPKLAIQIRTTEAKMDEEQKREVLLKFHY